MKILFVAPSLPINNGAGHAIRSYQLYSELQTFADVDVVTANSVGISFPLIREFKKSHNYITHIDIDWRGYIFGVSYSLSKELRAILINGKYDYVFIRYYNTAYRLGALKIPNLLLDCDDCYLELLLQSEENIGSRFLERTQEKVSKFFRQFNYVRNIENIHRVTFSKKSSKIPWKKNFRLIQNKISYVEPRRVDFSNVTPDSYVTILFIGVLNYAPNYEGLFYFVENIWPIIMNACPQVRLKIVGAGLPTEYFYKWSKDSKIQLCGFVKDIDSVYADVDLTIAPIYKGSGTHIKVMESLIRSKTMVISPLAHRGYEKTLLNEKSLYVAASTEEFSERIIQLVNDKNLREKMGRVGREAVISHHTIETSPPELETLLAQTKNKISDSVQIEHSIPNYGGTYE